jgi:hypothetical protein
MVDDYPNKERRQDLDDPAFLKYCFLDVSPRPAESDKDYSTILFENP